MSDTVTQDNIFVGISNGYYHFTVSEKKVADYVLAHKTSVQYMSISELAEECGVADATISRFCRRLKVTGYNAFKLAIAKATAEEGRAIAPRTHTDMRKADSVVEMSRRLCDSHTAAIAQSLALVESDKIKKAVDLLCAATRVYFMGQGGSMYMSMVAAHQFATISPRFFAVQDSHIQASMLALMTSGDVVVFFSYSGSTKELMENINLARDRGVKVILVTRFSNSPGAAMADVVLRCGSDEGPLQLGSMPAKMAQLFVLDVLFHEFCRRDPEAARHSHESVADALAERHL